MNLAQGIRKVFRSKFVIEGAGETAFYNPSQGVFAMREPPPIWSKIRRSSSATWRSDLNDLAFMLFVWNDIKSFRAHPNHVYSNCISESDGHPEKKMNDCIWNIFNFRDLKQAGFSVYSTASVDLVFTFRGNCMIDVFDRNLLKQVAYLDFDISKTIMLESAFRSPLIGLPFSTLFRKRFETDLLPIKDLRSKHEVGFFVDIDYRNKGEKEIWNIDELMMAIAFETAFEDKIQDFTIKPTGDTAPYYRKKFKAKICRQSTRDLIMTVHLKTARKQLKHIRVIEKDDKTFYFRVKGVSDI